MIPTKTQVAPRPLAVPPAATPYSLVLFTSLIFVGLGNLSADEQDQKDKAWARSMREIPFQNDSQWNDNRWQQTDIGPFLSASIETGGNNRTLKGIAIRIGDKQQATAVFDTARLRFSAAWTGGFLKLDGRRFGLIRRPQAAGDVFYSTPKTAGWANGERFDTAPKEITLPQVEEGYCPPGSSVLHLPASWAKYRGLYTSGERIVLSYTVGETNVLESPWYVQHKETDVFIRSLEIGPSTKTQQLLVSESEAGAMVVGDPSATLIQRGGKRILMIAPHDRVVRVQLLITAKELPATRANTLRKDAGNIEQLSEMIRQDVGRWPQVLRTKGTTSDEVGPFVIDTLTIPFENPFGALFFTSGHDFFRDGSAAICTVHGDVWVVEGIDRHLENLTWRRFATGLFQPLGLKIVDDQVFVVGRDQVTRLHDRNGDGEADFYENFNNSLFISPNTHDFVTCLDTDPDGKFYFIHAKTGVMQVTADGSQIRQIADGFRNPNGMAVGPDGTITAAPQQGQWTPESSIIVVKEGGYYGFRGPRITSNRPTGWDLPMCFIPRAMDNSGGAQVWVAGKRWGPLEEKMLHLSYGQCRILLALTETVNGVPQGGTTRLSTSPQDFESGIMRGRFRSQDGQLYVSGLRGWQTRSIRDGCFQRVRYTGEPLHLAVAVNTYTNGIKLTFTEPLHPDTAQDPDNFFVTQWNYRWTAEYGSPEYSVAQPSRQGRDEVPVVSASLLDDGYAVFLEMPNLQPVHQLNIDWLLSSVSGKTFRGNFAHTINTPPSESIPETRIQRRPRSSHFSPEEVARLRPGLLFQITSNGDRGTDTRTSRLAAYRHPLQEAVTPFLNPGSHEIHATGSLQIPLSGDYHFRLEGNGIARLWINDRECLDIRRKTETTEPVRLQKGHNRIRIQYESPHQGTARFGLFWKGYNFDWEPVPPKSLFHDSGHSGLAEATRRRFGRNLFAQHHCAKCHQTRLPNHEMFELSLVPPDLADSGARFNPTWLVHWLIDPAKFRPTSHMPMVLHSKTDATQAAADIATYLLSSDRNAVNSPSADPIPAGDDESGAVLFEQLGCISCHHFAAPRVESDGEQQRISLHFAKAKFQPGALQRFLLQPAAHHSATTMPDFQLSNDEALALARFINSQATGVLPSNQVIGNADRGSKLFAEVGCRNCHAVAGQFPLLPTANHLRPTQNGCLSMNPDKQHARSPRFNLSNREKTILREFIQNDLPSLQYHNSFETSHRLFRQLRCAACHDRDDVQSNRIALLAEEGSGRVPELIPDLTWAGERFRVAWSEKLFQGKLPYKSRPWLKARMPAFPRYARELASGLASEHAVAMAEESSSSPDSSLVKIGERLTLSNALDCRQCHAIGELLPRGDEKTQIAIGINFTHIRDRLRRPSYDRFMMDPSRYDPKTKMIRLSANGKSTKLTSYFDADAKKQFGAIWHYIQSLP